MQYPLLPAGLEFDFVITDSHFWHKNIIKYADRPFADAEEMSWAMLERWNAVVRPHHKVLHGGDLVMGPFLEGVEFTSLLNGDKYLIPGNHDRVSPAFNDGKYIERTTPIYEAAGWTILPGVVQTTIAGRDVLLSHYPYEGDSRDGVDRHQALRPVDTGLPLIHGHVHTRWAENGRQFNAGVDLHGFTPVPILTIEDWVRSL